jgi:transcriptional regulator with XRE-family HTH domain
MDELRRLRKAKKLSQARLAALADLDPSTVNQIETGARQPNTRTLEKLATVLGVGVSDLFPKAQAPLPLEPAEKSQAGSGLTLDEVRAFLVERVGSSWIALPEGEWDNWWRDVSRAEAVLRRRQIAAEYQLIAQEVMATAGKADKEPELVPREGRWGDVAFTLLGRNMSARFFAPQKGESAGAFKERQRKGVAAPAFYKDLREDAEQALRAAAEAG